MLDSNGLDTGQSWEERVTGIFSGLSIVSLLCYIVFSNGLVYYFSIVAKVAKKLLPLLG